MYILGVLGILIILFAIYILIVIFIYLYVGIKNYKKKRMELQNQKLLIDFVNKYDLEYIPNNAVVESTQSNIDENKYRLIFPHWRYENNDKSKDLRIKNNYIVWEDSYLYVDNYSIAFDNPLSLMKCVYSLRDKGISIKKSYYELDKINQKKWDFEKFETKLSIQELIDLYRETPTDFEQYCASLFERIGLKSFVTPPSNDGGYDIKLFKNSSLYALVECKLYEDTKVSRPQIQKLVGASAIENTNNLIFITTSDFSNEAIEFAKKTDVHLLNGKALVKFSNYVSKNESNQFDENSVQLNIYDFAKYMPKDILAMCYDEI